jgi:hypothetical protein
VFYVRFVLYSVKSQCLSPPAHSSKDDGPSSWRWADLPRDQDPSESSSPAGGDKGEGANMFVSCSGVNLFFPEDMSLRRSPHVQGGGYVRDISLETVVQAPMVQQGRTTGRTFWITCELIVGK